MEEIVLTPRLKLTLVKSTELGSQDLEWQHKIRSDAGATSWSIYGMSPSLEHTQAFMRKRFVTGLDVIEKSDKRRMRFGYIIHKREDEENISAEKNKEGEKEDEKSRVIGAVSFRPEMTFPLPQHLTVDDSLGSGVLKMEIGYCLITSGWGKGYASEAVAAALAAFKRSREFWAPFEKVYVEGIVGPENVASCRVMEKVGLKKIGTFSWEGERIVLAGALRENIVAVYGTWVVE